MSVSIRSRAGAGQAALSGQGAFPSAGSQLPLCPTPGARSRVGASHLSGRSEIEWGHSWHGGTDVRGVGDRAGPWAKEARAEMQEFTCELLYSQHF